MNPPEISTRSFCHETSSSSVYCQGCTHYKTLLEGYYSLIRIKHTEDSFAFTLHLPPDGSPLSISHLLNLVGDFPVNLIWSEGGYIAVKYKFNTPFSNELA